MLPGLLVPSAVISAVCDGLRTMEVMWWDAERSRGVKWSAILPWPPRRRILDGGMVTVGLGWFLLWIGGLSLCF